MKAWKDWLDTPPIFKRLVLLLGSNCAIFPAAMVIGIQYGTHTIEFFVPAAYIVCMNFVALVGVVFNLRVFIPRQAIAFVVVNRDD